MNFFFLNSFLNYISLKLACMKGTLRNNLITSLVSSYKKKMLMFLGFFFKILLSIFELTNLKSVNLNLGKMMKQPLDR